MTRMRVYRCANGSVGPSLSLPFVMPCLPPYDEKHMRISKQKSRCSSPVLLYPFWTGRVKSNSTKNGNFLPIKVRLCGKVGIRLTVFLSGEHFFENSRMGLVLQVGCHRFLEQAGGGRRRPGNGVSACLNGFPNEFLCGTAGSDQREIR